MLPKYHILAGIVFSLILIIFFNISLIPAVIVFLASVLIDVDHYAYYVLKDKNISLKKAYIKFKRLDEKYLSLPLEKQNKYYYSLCIFHGIESILLIFILAYIFKFNLLFFIALGFSYHLFFDIIQKIYEEGDPFVLLSLTYKYYYDKSRKNFWDEYTKNER